MRLSEPIAPLRMAPLRRWASGPRASWWDGAWSGRGATDARVVGRCRPGGRTRGSGRRPRRCETPRATANGRLGQGHRWISFSECLTLHTEDPADEDPADVFNDSEAAPLPPNPTTQAEAHGQLLRGRGLGDRDLQMRLLQPDLVSFATAHHPLRMSLPRLGSRILLEPVLTLLLGRRPSDTVLKNSSSSICWDRPQSLRPARGLGNNRT